MVCICFCFFCLLFLVNFTKLDVALAHKAPAAFFPLLSDSLAPWKLASTFCPFLWCEVALGPVAHPASCREVGVMIGSAVCVFFCVERFDVVYLPTTTAPLAFYSLAILVPANSPLTVATTFVTG